MRTKPIRSWRLAAAPILVMLVALAAVAAAPPNLERALSSQRSLLEKEPANVAALIDLGNLLQLAGRTREAEEAYRRALELDPQQATAHFNLGLLLQARGDGLAALRHFRRAVKLDPRHAWAHYQIGVLEEGWGMRELAIQSYARAFALDPELRFPDVNPHVLDNALLTEAMLYAYRHHLPAPQPPPSYEQPARIAGLLLERERRALTPAQEAAPQTSAAPTPTGAGSVEAPAQPLAGTRVLAPRDLEPGSRVGQVSSGSGGRTAVGVPAPQPAPEIYDAQETLRIQRPASVEEDAGHPLIVPYQPGQPSTGRLEMRLYDRPSPRSHEEAS